MSSKYDIDTRETRITSRIWSVVDDADPHYWHNRLTLGEVNAVMQDKQQTGSRQLRVCRNDGPKKPPRAA